MKRKQVLAANWKMNMPPQEAETFFSEFNKLCPSTTVEIIIAPPFVSLERSSLLVKGTPVHLAGQNMYWESKGAFTGEISSTMLKSLGCSHVIIGHSERRHIFGETDEDANKKVKRGVSDRLSVILCVGETLQEREGNQTLPVLKRQVEEGLRGISKEALKQVIIAYEPVWAIGTGKVATPDQAEEAHKHIRKVVWDLYGMEEASHVPILYGGSVKPSNFAEISAKPNVDGALVGGASLKAKSFIEILEQMK